MKQYFQTEYTKIKVIPQQSKAEFRGIMGDGTLKIALKSAPEKGKANKELVAFIAGQLGITKDQIVISSGLTSRVKVIRVKQK